MSGDIRQTVYQALDSLGITYCVIDHPPAATMEDCERISEQLKAPVCKNLFLCNRQKTVFYLLMIPADKPFKTKYLSEQIVSSRLSFADAALMQDLLRVDPGSASVFCLLFDSLCRIHLLIDEDVLRDREIGAHPCLNTSTVKISTQELLNVFLPSVSHSYQTVKLPYPAAEE